MKYVALLSGGKDSCYNLLHCKKNGHELVAAASLGPGSGKEELDSYMYQTVGQDAIQLVAQALDVPLYRATISGSAIEQGSEYGDRNSSAHGVQGDETEDLFNLLLEVKSHHADIQGVSAGAILSNYQRVRVEHVCRRLGLTALSYLWQRDQADLLSEMIEAGLEAILIKVAGIGLTVKHLGQSLSEMQPTLQKLNDLYGSHICGEGGEYETLTLDSPLFKSRIVLKDVETVIHSDNDFATVAFLRVKDAVLEPKDPSNASPSSPPLLRSNIVLDAVKRTQTGSPAGAGSHAVEDFLHPSTNVISHSSGNWVTVSNIEADRSADTLEEELVECFAILKECLSQHSLDLSNCVFVTIFLSSMDLFPQMNAVYSTYFGTSPPARACVAVDLPSARRLRLECIAFTKSDPQTRQALHVQGLSYWAPANIGPYSQAIVVNERIFISGQIGLIPSSLTLPYPPSLALETALSMQHLEVITDALQPSSPSRWLPHSQLVLYWVASTSHVAAIQAGHLAHQGSNTVPTLFLVVKSLPKDSLVEKQALLHSGHFQVPDDEDGELESRLLAPSFTAGIHGPCEWQISSYPDGTSSGVICGHEQAPEDIRSISDLAPLWREVLSIRLFYVPSFPVPFDKLLAGYGLRATLPLTLIPCRRLATMSSDNWQYAICIITA